VKKNTDENNPICAQDENINNKACKKIQKKIAETRQETKGTKIIILVMSNN